MHATKYCFDLIQNQHNTERPISYRKSELQWQIETMTKQEEQIIITRNVSKCTCELKLASVDQFLLCLYF